jgi:hypothetical protein
MKSLSLQQRFDLAKKEFEKGNTNDGYYMADSNKTYKTHYTNSKWEEFVSEMKMDYPEAYDRYYNCPGGEMKEYYDKRWKQLLPPKMASYGSSSRFIYMISRHIPSFWFEEGLPISFPGYGKEAEASLDGFYEKKCIFVEAKCHEFYNSLNTEFKEKYEDFYNYLVDATGGRFSFVVNKKFRKPTVRFSWEKTPITQFDLKQVLCHLLGIAKKTLQDNGKYVPTLVYLVYKPSPELLGVVEKRFGKRTANTIKSHWEKECKEYILIPIQQLYKHVVNYLYEKKGVGQNVNEEDLKRISSSFCTRLCNQDDFLSFIDNC